MKLKLAPLCTALGLMAATAACSGSSPLQPTITGAAITTIATTTTTTPKLAAPADGSPILFASQPVTLTITNAVATSAAPRTYTFEVATDSAFSTIVYSKAGVAEGANGQTSLTIDKLKSSTTFYWRSRVVSGSTTGLAATPKTFAIGPEVILQTPVLASPAQNGTLTGTPVLTTNNVQKSGPAGLISYQFDVADSASFGKIVFTAKVNEQAGGKTSVNITTALTSGATYFWRVQASDPPSGVTSEVSSGFSFKFVAFDPLQAIFHDNPPDVGSWPETAKITSIRFTRDAMLVDFDKREGPGSWPESASSTFGPLQYTLGMCFNIDNQWHCSAAIQFWAGRDLNESGPPSDIAENWYYHVRWGAMAGHQPADGEQVAVFVGQGNLRGGGGATWQERSDFVIIPFWSDYTR